LLLAHYDVLAKQVESRLPPRLQATQAVEDILQVTFCQAFRDISRFEPRGNSGFGNWLSAIAENRLLDAIKQHDAAKRGGEGRQVQEPARDDSRVLPLLDWIVSQEKSPSSVIARNEALQALHIALAGLATDQREAIRLRHLEGKSLEETAAVMGRTPDAVRGLVHRGKQQLQQSMGRASRWLKTN
jgi:RNA polymerase sigma-70 factor (ECF subfamily)